MKWNSQLFIFRSQMRSRLCFISAALTLGGEDVHSCHTPWFHLMAVKPQPSALRDPAPLSHKANISTRLPVTGRRQSCRYSVSLRQMCRILKGRHVWAVCVLLTVLRELAPNLFCQSLIALVLFLWHSPSMFSAHLRAIWHRYRYWSHMLLVLMLASIYVVRTLAFSQEKYAKTKSTAWRWKCSNNTHSSPNPTMHSGFPSFISRLVTTAENGAVPNRPLPCLPTILCCYLGSQVCACPSPRLKRGIISEPEVAASEKIFLQCWLLRSGIWEISLQLVDCCLGKFPGPTWVPSLEHSGQTVLCSRTFQLCTWGLGGSMSGPDSDFCNLWIATAFLTIQRESLPCLQC